MKNSGQVMRRILKCSAGHPKSETFYAINVRQPPYEVAQDILDKNGYVAAETYMKWLLDNPITEKTPNLVFDICELSDIGEPSAIDIWDIPGFELNGIYANGDPAVDTSTCDSNSPYYIVFEPLSPMALAAKQVKLLQAKLNFLMWEGYNLLWYLE